MRKATGSYRTYSIPSKTTALVPKFAVEDLRSAELQPWFLSLRWKTCVRQNCSLGSCACSEGPPLGSTL